MNTKRAHTLATLLACTYLTQGCASRHGTPIYALHPRIVAIHMIPDTADVLVPTAGNSAFRRAVREARTGDFTLARQTLERLVLTHPDDWKVRYVLAVAQEALGDTSSANQNYHRALQTQGADSFSCQAGILRTEEQP